MEKRSNFVAILLFACVGLFLTDSVWAGNIEKNTAKMQALDKITGQMSVIEVPVNGEVRFGSFSVVVRNCQATPQEETPDNYAFVDITDTQKDGKTYNIFKGWMISSSPSLNSVEHPIYDVWLLRCFDAKDVSKQNRLTEAQLTARDNIEKYQEKEVSKEAKIAQKVQKEQAKQEQLVKEEQAKQDKQKEEQKEAIARQQEIEKEMEQNLEPVLEEPMDTGGDGPVSLLNFGQNNGAESPKVIVVTPSDESQTQATLSESPTQASAEVAEKGAVVIEDTHHETIEQELDLPADINEILP